MAILKSSDRSVVRPRIELDERRITIGRHPECEVQIEEGAVSRKHAAISFRDNAYFLDDLSSRNGTFLNEQKVSESARLFDGAEIKICDVSFVFQSHELADNPTAPATKERDRQSVDLPSFTLHDDAGANIDSQIEASVHYLDKGTHVSTNDKLQTLMKVARTLSESLERDEILSKILDILFELFTEADRGFIILKMPDGALRPLAFKTRRAQDDENIRVSRTIVNSVMETQCPVVSSDASQDDRFDHSQSVVDFRIRSIMCAPLVNNKNESIGVIQLDTIRSAIAFKESDLETLATIALQGSLAIQKTDLVEESRRAREMKSDLKLAHELQLRFLPQRPPQVDHYSFASHYRAMQQVGGDYFDYIELDGDHIAIIMADVVGHGIAAAMLMAKVSAESRFALATTKSAAQAISKLNDKLTDLKLDRFVTLALCLLNTKENTVEIVNAGHMPPIIRRADDGSLLELSLEHSGLPVGIMAGYEYKSTMIELNPGDLIVLYTDGINEAMNAQGKQFTTDAIIREIKISQSKTPEAVNKVIRDAVAQHMGTEKAIDDMCLVTVGRDD
jgi:serine phosphatase RsbU (regulator of sigma subunit)/pSer/pThr/pTyr-binding forkhead associated (FHA) protein